MELTSFLFIPENNSGFSGRTLGGKAENLFRLLNLGVRVPRWIALDADLPDSMIEEAVENLMVLQGDFFAVRSSAVGEDGGEHSFAGQLDSFLFVRREALAEAIRNVRLSGHGERAAAYRRQNHLEHHPVRVAVIVQEMIDADAAGVAFALDLKTGSRSGATISAVYGLGEGLVSGELPADTFYVQGGVITSSIALKEQAFAFAEGGGTRLEAVPEKQQNQPAISDAMVLEIAETTQRLSAALGRPQDCEWAVKEGRLYWLQTRPVTTLSGIADPEGAAVLWDNSNIVESYPDLTTPLTFSFIRTVYSEVYKQFCLMMGVEREMIAANAEAFEMLGFIEGRVFYNLFNWYKLLMMLPGYSINARFMEQMMGVKEPLKERPVIVESTRGKYRRLAGLVTRTLNNLIRLDSTVAQFHRYFNETVSPLEGKDLSTASPQELIRVFRDLESKLLCKWQPPLVNDFFAMIFYGLLKKLLVKWEIDAHGTLQNNLLAGTGDIISTEPVRLLKALARTIRQTPELKAALARDDFLKARHRFPEFSADFDQYLTRFGSRCMGELKLETLTYRENPEPLVGMLRAYVQNGAPGTASAENPEHALRGNAEATIREKLKGHFFKRKLFGWVLRKTRKLVQNRENLRFERTRLFAVVREIFLAFGARFYREGLILAPRDVFYLTKEEIFDFIEGTATTHNLKALIALRKEEERHFKAPDERFTTRGMVYHANTFKHDHPEPAETPGDSLTGIGCCGGIIRAQVRVVRNPSIAEGLNGKILVAERTDPGWAPLFPVCKGVLVERGSILSHAAIVTRELGIPSIVGIAHLLTALKDGDWVEMNGSTGIVTRLGEGEKYEL